MRGERDKDVDSLIGSFGIGRRLATRVVALRARRLEVTGTLLAEAAESEALAELLLGPRLLEELPAMDQEELKRRAREAGYEEWELLRVAVDPETGWRTVALEDDLLAEQARREAGEVGLVASEPRGISAAETAELFTPEEVARLKLSVLTSQNADERIEAVRKLVYAPMDGAQKAGVFLNVLIDREAEARVRREAVRSLEQIGFRSDMAEAVRGLFEEDREEAVYSIQRLGVLLREAEAGESALVLAVVLELFDQAREVEMLRQLLQLISGCASILVSNYQKTEQFIQSALRHLARDLEPLRLEVAGAIRACAEQAPELAADLMWRELKRSEVPAVRGLLLNLIETLAEDEARVDELAEMAVAELLNPALPESEKARLRYGLVRLGQPAVLIALDRMAGAGGAERPELIRLIDTLCTESDVSCETVQRAIGQFIDLLKVADALTRRSVLEASLLADPRVESELQTELAGELLTLMSEVGLPSTQEAIQSTLERIGAAALEPAYRFMRRAYPSEPAQRAALALAAIVENAPDQVPREVAEGALEVCMRLLGDEKVEQGAFAVALGAVCGYTEPGAEQFAEALRRLTDDLWRSAYTMDALDALGVMAGSPNADAEAQGELLELFDGIVRFQARTSMGARKETEEGPVYEFGREIEFDIRAVPAAVKGLERICVSPSTAPEVRREIVKRLLVLWEGVSKVRIIWGPAAIEALIRAMCAAACSPQATVAMKTRLVESLLRFLNKITVVRSIGEICAAPRPEDPRMRRLAVQAAEALLAEWEESELQDEERNLALLRSAARIAANPALDAASEPVRELRERTLQGLFSGLRDGMTPLRDSLVLMRDCPGLAPAQKREIDERLGKAFGLVRIGER